MLYIISFLLQVLSLLLYNTIGGNATFFYTYFCSAVHSKTRNPQRESPAVQSAKNSFHSDNNSIYRNFSQVHDAWCMYYLLGPWAAKSQALQFSPPNKIVTVELLFMCFRPRGTLFIPYSGIFASTSWWCMYTSLDFMPRSLTGSPVFSTPTKLSRLSYYFLSVSARRNRRPQLISFVISLLLTPLTGSVSPLFPWRWCVMSDDCQFFD